MDLGTGVYSRYSIPVEGLGSILIASRKQLESNTKRGHTAGWQGQVIVRRRCSPAFSCWAAKLLRPVNVLWCY